MEARFPVFWNVGLKNWFPLNAIFPYISCKYVLSPGSLVIFMPSSLFISPFYLCLYCNSCLPSLSLQLVLLHFSVSLDSVHLFLPPLVSYFNSSRFSVSCIYMQTTFLTEYAVPGLFIYCNHHSTTHQWDVYHGHTFGCYICCRVRRHVCSLWLYFFNLYIMQTHTTLMHYNIRFLAYSSVLC